MVRSRSPWRRLRRSHREPGFWDKIKRGLGGKVDLDTGEVRVALEASALVDQVKRALVRLGIDNAVSLVVDDTIIFQDIEGRPGDLPDLILALSEHASVFGRGFREMKLAVEHDEGVLHLLVEVRALTQHKRNEPSAYVSIGGRIRIWSRGKGEAAEAYRARVEPMAKDAGLLATARMQFPVVRRPPGSGAARGAARGAGRGEARRGAGRAPDDAAHAAAARIRVARCTIRTRSTTR